MARVGCLADTGDRAGAVAAARRALGLTEDPAVRQHLLRTLETGGSTAGPEAHVAVSSR